ncbi:hypothetical protein BU16DRAFT_526563 [Lophium mytilinum]|uniref:Uncharacterized protein n=1 Tax=Lophium mytilinum TaxID=390894 RepID=A0A6A6QV87_9PEZI|nr:hypothetical protein BU16DRAFT_526563 [Lophium mytilinum]
MVSLTYVPRDASNIFQSELWVDNIERLRTGPGNAFELRVPGIGHVRCDPDSTTSYEFSHPSFSFSAKTRTHTPWSPSKSTPEGILVHLPLPLHWHVQSLASECDFELHIPSLGLTELPNSDRSGQATVHQEKNWANSFPKAHIWIQARADDGDGPHGICLAGGQVLGMTAYLLGYRGINPLHNIDFTPPYALSVFGLSPFMTVNNDWEKRRFDLSVQVLWQKVVVKATAPAGTFFALAAPFGEGFRDNFLAESFAATVDVEVWRKSGWGSWFGFGEWQLVCKDRFEDASLEFGGEYYPLRGSEKKRN